MEWEGLIISYVRLRVAEVNTVLLGPGPTAVAACSLTSYNCPPRRLSSIRVKFESAELLISGE